MAAFVGPVQHAWFGQLLAPGQTASLAAPRPAGSSAPTFAAAASAAVSAAAAAGAARRAARKGNRKPRAALRSVVLQPGPLPHVVLSEGDSQATVYLRGAHLASFKAKGVEWLGLRADCALDGSKQNISGGFPICFPQFGPGEVIVQHGFARNMDWELDENKSSESKCVLILEETEETMKTWPHQFRCTYTVELKDDELHCCLKVVNKSESDCTFTAGIHSYYNTSDVDTLRIEGKFSSCTKEDRTQDPPEPTTYDKDEITISQFADEIYQKVWPGTVTLKDPKKGELDIVSGGGWRDLVIWNPYGDDKMGYKTFVCVESVEGEPVHLKPGAAWDATVKLVARNT